MFEEINIDYHISDSTCQSNVEESGEIMAQVAYGNLNTIGKKCDYINYTHNMKLNSGFKYSKIDHFVNKKDQLNYLKELEEYDMNNELENLEKSIELDLNLENSTYSENLKLSLENNSAEIDLGLENIVHTHCMWNGATQIYKEIKISNTELLCDVYMKIEKLDGEFGKHDMYIFQKIDSIELYFYCCGYKYYKMNILTCMIHELLKENKIQQEPNIVWFKCFDFNKFYEALSHFDHMKLHMRSILYDLDISKLHLYDNYKIDIVYSSKHKIIQYYDIHHQLFNPRNITFVHHQTCINMNINEKKILLDINSCIGLCSVIFCMFVDSKYCNLKHNNLISQKTYLNNLDNFDNFDDLNELDELDELNELNKLDELDDLNYLDDLDDSDKLQMEKIILYLNGHQITYDKKQLVKIEFCGMIIYAICIDPKMKNKKTLISYMKSDFDIETLKSINFSRIDSINICFNYKSKKKYNTNICCLKTMDY